MGVFDGCFFAGEKVKNGVSKGIETDRLKQRGYVGSVRSMKARFSLAKIC